MSKSYSQQKGLFAQLGQGMSEYLIIVALIAVAAIGVMSFMGQTLENQMAAMSKELSGQDAASERTAAQTAANSAATNAGTRKTLDNYATGNAQ